MVEIPYIPGFSGTGPITPTSQTPQIVNIPLSLAQLPLGTLINAVVVRADKSGNLLLKTKDGELNLSSKVLLPEGTQIVLKVLSNNQNPQPQYSSNNLFVARLISVDGKPISQVVNQQPVPTQNQNIKSPQTLQKTQGVQLASGLTIIPDDFDIIQVPSPQPKTQQSQQLSANASSQVSTSTIINTSKGSLINAVVLSASPEAPKVLADINNSIKQIVSSSNYVKPATLPTNLNVSDIVNFRIQAINLPNQTAPASGALQNQPAGSVLPNTPLQQTAYTRPQSAPGTTITATVIGTEKSGELVVKTPLGTLKIPTELSLPKGTVLELETVSIKNIQASTPPNITSQIRLMSEHKSTLEEIFRVVKNANPALAEKIINEIVPNTDRNFPVKLFAHLTNAVSKEQPALLNNQVRQALEQEGRPELFTRFTSEISSFRQIASEHPNHWQGMPFAVYDGKEFQYGNFYWKRYKKHGNEQVSATRFIVDIDFNALGIFQIDGFVREQKRKKELELQIKTKNSLPKDMQEEMTTIFVETAEAVGIKGSLQFNSVEKFSLLPFDEDFNEDGPLIV